MKTNWRYWLGVFLLAAGLFAGCGKESIPQPREAQGAESQEAEDAQETERDQETGIIQETESTPETESAQETEVIPETEDALGTEAIQETEEEQGTKGVQNTEGIQESEKLQVGTAQEDASDKAQVLEDGAYTSKEEVAEYIAIYGHLPDNFITKKEAKALGWVSSEGNLGVVAPGKSIGGDYFGNYEGNLPEKEGREYHECDIDSDGGYRGAKRIVYSNDGLIYYTEDHYETFELLYGEE
ncbi:MAG: ribonuclease [Lachnospiraceae bacterium]|nr:ribonuclease [Lachnospiraceae bacterium]